MVSLINKFDPAQGKNKEELAAQTAEFNKIMEEMRRLNSTKQANNYILATGVVVLAAGFVALITTLRN